MIELVASSGDRVPVVNSGINITLKNPLLKRDGFEGSYSLPFTLPATDDVKKKFGFPHRIIKSGAANSVDVDVLFNGRKFAGGSLVIDQANEDQYECHLRPGMGDFVSKIKDRKITEFDYGGDFRLIPEGITDEQMALAFVTGSYSTIFDIINAYPSQAYPGVPGAFFPVLNPNLYSGTDCTPIKEAQEQLGLYMNYYREGFKPVQCLVTIDHGLPGEYQAGIYAFSPVIFPYLCHVVKYLFAGLGYLIVENCIEADDDLKKITIFNTFIDNHPATLDVLGATLHFLLPNETYNIKNHLPNYSIADFLNSIENFLGIAFYINDRNKTVKIKNIWDPVRNEIEYSNVRKVKNISFDNFASYSWQSNGDDNDSFWAEQVKDVEADKYLGELYDISDLPATGTAGDVYLIQHNGSIYDSYLVTWSTEWSSVFKQFNATQWVNFAWDRKLKGVSNESSFNLSTNASTLFCGYFEDETYGHPLGRMWLVPKLLQVGVNPRFSQLNNNNADISRLSDSNFSLRFLFYHGIQLVFGNLYPLGTNSYYTNLGGTILGDLSLKWDGDYGLYEKRWKKFLNWILNIRKPVTIYKQMTVEELENFDFTDVFLINGVKYLIDEVNLTVSSQGLGEAELKCYTC